jgi:DNA-binding SARP family transcriptional activator
VNLLPTFCIALVAPLFLEGETSVREARMSVKIALLGEVTAQVDRLPVNLGPARQRCVLAALAVDAGRLVPADRLMGRVWGADTPRRGRATLHSYISRLRAAFAGALTIVHRSDGYLLVTDRANPVIDLLRFRALRDQARETKEDTHRASLLADALRLWRGEPLIGLSGEWVDAEREKWQQQRRATEHELIDAQLRLGHGEELVAQLAARTMQYPLDERVGGQYMLALHRAARTADALGHYQQLRTRLVDELGTDPGAALQNLHQQILAADPNLIPGPTSTATEPFVTPRQLPTAPTPFVGRRNELDQLNLTASAASPAARADDSTSPVSMSARPSDSQMVLISAISGAGGTGKTWLALHWAHRHVDRFPDGQLFVDLHGFSPTEQPARPADVLGGFLYALGVDRDRQPADPDRRAELYRSLVTDKRMLVVLDNAATTDQVIPLLPSGRQCVVLITSRNHLHGLIARHGARPVHLDMFTDTEAHILLAATLGSDHAEVNTQAIRELIELCGGFPLALGLIAARAITAPHLPLGDTVAELRAHGLDALDALDPTASLPAVLSWSLHHLSNSQRQMFALLGIAPGPDVGLSTVANLTGLSEREARAVLRILIDASLIHPAPGGRYGTHNLVRAYAATVAEDLPIEIRESALRRVLDYVTHTAHSAARLLDPQRDPAPLDPPTPGVRPQLLLDTQAALGWLDTEHACLLAAQRIAATQHWHPTVWHLAWALNTFHHRRGHRHDRLSVWRTALDAANHLPDPATRTRAHRTLGLAHIELGHHEDALNHLHRALALAEDQHASTQQARTHYALAWAWGQQGDDRQALNHAGRALELYRGLGQSAWEADALTAVGWFEARLGDYAIAREHCHAALTLHRLHHNLDGEADTLDSLGYIEHHSGNHSQAIEHHYGALTLRRDHGNTYQAADTLDALGHSHFTLGQHEQARTAWQQALTLYQKQGRPDDAARTQRQLDDLNSGDNPFL